MYIVTEFFEDMKDDRRPYLAGSVFPAEGAPKPSKARLEQLAGQDNARGRPAIVKLQPEVVELLEAGMVSLAANDDRNSEPPAEEVVVGIGEKYAASPETEPEKEKPKAQKAAEKAPAKAKDKDAGKEAAAPAT